jgi:rare lipoprotein A
MRLLNNAAPVALILMAVSTAPALAQQQPVSVPTIAMPGSAPTPPTNLPAGSGPSATSGSSAAARFDQVGYAGLDRALSGASVAVAGLRPGVDVEITALDSGRIILALAAGGMPPTGRLAGLSPDAAAALGVTGTKPFGVRVREVQPQAGDEAALRRGEAASPRLGAPASLLTGLRARLATLTVPTAAAPPRATPATIAPGPGLGPNMPTPHLRPPTPAVPSPKSPTAGAKPEKVGPAASKPTKPEPAPAVPAKPRPKPQPTRSEAAATGAYHVQVGTFSNEANARALASRIGGHVSPAGKFWRVELGPFTTAAAAQQARDGVAKRGYGDARVRKD